MPKMILTFAAMVAGTLSLASSIQGAVVTLAGVETRSGGPFGNPDVTSSMPASHGGIPSVTWSLTASNQILDSDAAADDSFTFDFTATTTNANGVSIWGQGINNSNGAGNNTSFGNAEGITFTVSNIVGTTTAGDAIVFDGFTRAVAASGGSGEIDRTIDINGTTATILSASTGAFQFVQAGIDLAPTPTVVFDNQGFTTAGSGSMVARSFDFQFSSVAVAIPEPSSLALLSVGAIGFVTRRRR
tara:strand:- start:1683 stop:2414 length:732 start_codon:yes stop_codon:yes gene_type:complete